LSVAEFSPGRPRRRAALRIGPGLLALALVLSLGCTIHRKAQEAYDEGKYEEALTQYSRLLDRDPSDIQARIGYRRTAPRVAELHLQRARLARKEGREDEERQEVAAAVLLDPANAVAADWMNRLELAAARKRALAEQQSVEAVREEHESRPLLPINPRSLEGMDLNFTRKTSLREILQQLARNSGVNIVLHNSASAQDPMVSVDLRGLSFQKVLDTLMLQNDMFYRVIDPNTIMVFRKTPQNMNEFENRLIKTFYLSNADIDNVRQIFQAILPQVRVFPDKRMNALTIQARGNDMAVAQHIVTQLDKPRAEVLIYLELLEVNANAQERVGLVPTINPLGTGPGLYRIGATTTNPFENIPGSNTTQGSLRISKSKISFLFPGLALDALKATGEGKLLASPNVRVVSGETGEVNIGEKVSTTQSSIQGLGQPTPTTGQAGGALATLGGALAAQTQYGYEQTGVIIKVKPRVHFNGDITVDLDATVNTLIPDTSASGRPNIGQRIIKTTARLQDGETAVFGGLLKEEEVKTLEGIWGLSDVPVLGTLLGHTASRKVRTDVILTMRAVVVRAPGLEGGDFDPFDPDQAPSYTKPFTPKPPAPKPDLPATAPQPAAPTPAPATGAQGGAAVEDGGLSETSGPDAARSAAGSSGPTEAVGAQQGEAPPDLSGTAPVALYLAPVTTEAEPGQRLTLRLAGSGTQGITSGTLTLKVDPRLKVLGLRPGDLTSGEGAAFQASGVGSGPITLTFSTTGKSDDGTLALVDLQAVDPGEALVAIVGGSLKAGDNPLEANFINALVSVD
jgi:type II secretory pathway component GspD/PulD (secretin)